MRKSLPSRLYRLLSVGALLFFCGAFSLVEAAGGPTILSDASSTRAIAFEAVTYRREPFPLVMPVQFSADTRNRIVLFVMNLDLMAGEGATALPADAEDAPRGPCACTVRNESPLPGCAGMGPLTL